MKTTQCFCLFQIYLYFIFIIVKYDIVETGRQHLLHIRASVVYGFITLHQMEFRLDWMCTSMRVWIAGPPINTRIFNAARTRFYLLHLASGWLNLIGVSQSVGITYHVYMYIKSTLCFKNNYMWQFYDISLIHKVHIACTNEFLW